MAQRTEYTEEYKSAALDRHYEPGATLSKVAKEPGRTLGQLKMWCLEREAAGSQEVKRRQQADAAEMTRLRKDNKRFELENEILHKELDFSQQGLGNHEEQVSVYWALSVCFGLDAERICKPRYAHNSPVQPHRWLNASARA